MAGSKNDGSIVAVAFGVVFESAKDLALNFKRIFYANQLVAEIREGRFTLRKGMQVVLFSFFIRECAVKLMGGTPTLPDVYDSIPFLKEFIQLFSMLLYWTLDIWVANIFLNFGKRGVTYSQHLTVVLVVSSSLLCIFTVIVDAWQIYLFKNRSLHSDQVVWGTLIGIIVIYLGITFWIYLRILTRLYRRTYLSVILLIVAAALITCVGLLIIIVGLLVAYLSVRIPLHLP